MFSKIQQQAFRQKSWNFSIAISCSIESYGALTSNVNDLRMGIKNDLPSSITYPATVVNFFAIQEVTRVEQSDSLKDLAPHHVIATWHPIAGTHGGMIPLSFDFQIWMSEMLVAFEDSLVNIAF
jgi:hypothetical protein